MNNFSEFTQKKEVTKKYNIVTGSFTCQFCGEIVGEAVVNRDEAVWKCSSGHESFMEWVW